MRHLGLEERMVRIIMYCLKLVTYEMLINGQPGGNIKPSRGLHQGDPLPPYLFLLGAMGLQSLLQQAKVNGHIRGVAICRNGPWVSHLFLLFCRATEVEF